jgi:hypothetical protein
MSNLLNLYFTSEYSRLRIFMNVVYIVAIIFITTRILSWYGYQYSNPAEITLAEAFHFIISGQVVLPIITGASFLGIYQLLASLLSAEIYKRYKYRLFRDIYDMRMHMEVPAELKRNRYVVEDEQMRISPGPRFKTFEAFMKIMFWEPFTVVAYWKLQAQTFFLLLLCLIIYPGKSGLIITSMVIIFVLWVFSQIFFYQLARSSEYQELYETVYYNATNPSNAKPVQPVITRTKYSDRYNERMQRKREKREAKNNPSRLN